MKASKLGMGVLATSTAVLALTPAPADAAVDQQQVKPRRVHRSFSDNGAKLKSKRRPASAPDVDPRTRDMVDRYLKDAAKEGRLYDVDDLTVTTTNAGSSLVAPALMKLESLEEHVVKDETGTPQSYSFDLKTETSPASPTAPPGLGFDSTLVYGKDIWTMQTAGPEVNYAEGKASAHILEDLDKSADFWEYHRETKAVPDKNSWLDWYVKNATAESTVLDTHHPYMLGMADYEPSIGQTDGCADINLTVGLYGFVGAEWLMHMCGSIEPMTRADNPHYMGAQYVTDGFGSGLGDEREVGANQLTKWYPNVWPAYRDQTRVSFCHYTNVDCEDIGDAR